MTKHAIIPRNNNEPYRIQACRVHRIGSPPDIEVPLCVNSFVTPLMGRFHQSRAETRYSRSVFLIPGYQPPGSHVKELREKTDHALFQILKGLLDELLHLSAPLNSLLLEAGTREPEREMLH